MQKTHGMILAGITALLAGAFLFMGCEDDPALGDVNDVVADGTFDNDLVGDAGDMSLAISPASASVSSDGQRISFQLLGGMPPITWTVADTRRGSVSTVGLRHDYVLYTAAVVGPNDITAIDGQGRAITASIDGNQGALAIEPESITLTRPESGQIVRFRVIGGIPPYGSFLASRPDLGSIRGDGTYVVVSEDGEGENLLSISDSGGNVAFATVTHAQEIPGLAIIPSSTSLTANGEKAVFLASGGYPPYTWALTYPDRGSFTVIDGRSIEYTRNAPGDQVVIVEDSEQTIAQVAVAQTTPTPPTIVPSAVTLASNVTSYAFSVTGGRAPYTWLVLTGTGTVNPNTGTQIVYTRGPADPPDNYILRVTDGNSQSALATITQE